MRERCNVKGWKNRLCNITANKRPIVLVKEKRHTAFKWAICFKAAWTSHSMKSWESCAFISALTIALVSCWNLEQVLIKTSQYSCYILCIGTPEIWRIKEPWNLFLRCLWVPLLWKYFEFLSPHTNQNDLALCFHKRFSLFINSLTSTCNSLTRELLAKVIASLLLEPATSFFLLEIFWQSQNFFYSTELNPWHIFQPFLI